MATRIRTIRPELWESNQLGCLPVLVRLLFIGLMSLADDDGRGLADQRFLMGRLHPFAEDLSTNDVGEALVKMAVPPVKGKPLVVLYEADGKQYYWLPGFTTHQRINRARPSSLPPPPGWDPSKHRQVVAPKPPAAGAPPPRRLVRPLSKPPAKPPEKPVATVTQTNGHKTNQQLIVETFAANRGVDIENTAIRDRFFKSNGAAAVELDNLCAGNLGMAKQAITDVARYLDACVVEYKATNGQKGIGDWRHLEAVNNNFVKWKTVFDKNLATESTQEPARG